MLTILNNNNMFITISRLFVCFSFRIHIFYTLYYALCTFHDQACNARWTCFKLYQSTSHRSRFDGLRNDLRITGIKAHATSFFSCPHTFFCSNFFIFFFFIANQRYRYLYRVVIFCARSKFAMYIILDENNEKKINILYRSNEARVYDATSFIYIIYVYTYMNT